MEHIIKALIELVGIILFMVGLQYNQNVIARILSTLGVIILIHTVTGIW